MLAIFLVMQRYNDLTRICISVQVSHQHSDNGSSQEKLLSCLLMKLNDDKTACPHELNDDKTACPHEVNDDKTACPHEVNDDKTACRHEVNDDKTACPHEVNDKTEPVPMK